MKNLTFRFARDIALEVRTLRRQLQRTKPEIPVTFDDSDSFAVNADAAEIAITPTSLAALMNSYMFAYPGAPIKSVSFTIKDNRLIQTGTVHKKVDLPFEITGSLSVTADGNIQLHADKIKSAHIPLKGLLHLFGEDLAKLLNQQSRRGLNIVGDDIILIPRSLTPPPHLLGQVTRVFISQGKIVQHFDSGRHPPVLNPSYPSEAYI